jgi:hypothetical protein
LGALARSWQKFQDRLGMHDGRLRLAIFKVLAIVRGMRERIYGHSNGADFGGAEECRDKFRRIREQDQNAVASRDTLVAQGISDTVGKYREFAVVDFAGFANDRDSFRMPPGRLIQKVLCNV